MATLRFENNQSDIRRDATYDRAVAVRCDRDAIGCARVDGTLPYFSVASLQLRAACTRQAKLCACVKYAEPVTQRLRPAYRIADDYVM